MNPLRFVRNQCPALWAFVLMWLCLVVPTDAKAQTDDGQQQIDTPGLDIEAVAGWDGIVDRSTPVPIALLLNNFSNAPLDAEVWLKDPWKKTEVSLGEIYVSEGASRRLTTIQSLQEWNECIVELRDRNKTLWRRVLAINTGQQFDKNVKYALVVNNSTRHLDLPNEAAVPFVNRTPNTRRRYSYNGASYTDEVTSVGKTQAIQSLNCKTWQLPTHSAVLMPANAVVFPDGVNTDDLNSGQWTALSEWICRGGTVFVHNKSQDIIQQLLTSSPLGHEPSMLVDSFSITQVGLGSICEFTAPLFDDGTAKAEQAISDIIAKRDFHHLPEMIRVSSIYNRESGRADRTRTWIMTFFAVYTLLSGVVTMFFFRKNRRTVVYYIVSLVLLACVASALLGGSLRYSQGDVHWVSVTQAGAGGVVQYAKLDLQSAGGRNTVMGVTGPNTDLQEISTSPNYYYTASNSDRFPPFSRQPSLTSANEGGFRINVPITPWGRRELNATSFNPDINKLDVSLKLVRDIGGSAAKASDVIYEIQVANTLPFDLVDARIYVNWLEEQTISRPAQDADSNSETALINEVVPYAYFSATQLGTIVTEQNLRKQFNIQKTQQTSSLSQNLNRGSVVLPSVSRIGATKAWLVGQISKSSSLKIDDANSDFSSAEELHFFVQEISTDELDQ